MTLAAEAPDLDVFWGFKGPVYEFAHHRGFTHSFLGLILTSALVTGFMYLVWLLRGKKTSIPGLAPHWGLLFLYAYVAGLSHIFLDFTNNYGVRPFWPFWEKWYSWDIVFIIEPALYIILLGGLLLPVILSRGEQIPRGRTSARIALITVVALYAARDIEHRRAVHFMSARDFDSVAPRRASAYPFYWNLFAWHGVAETKDSFFAATIDSRSGQISEMRQVTKPSENAATLRAKRSYLGRAYLDWAQYPLVVARSAGQNTVVEFKDLRYEYRLLQGRSPLSCTVELDKNLAIVREAFGDREQIPPVP